MNNAFLLNEAIDLIDFDRFKEGMLELNAIEKDFDDNFLKHNSIWNLPIFLVLYENFGQNEQVISKFIEQLTLTEDYIGDENALDSLFPDECNCFLGIDFSSTTTGVERQIRSNLEYNTFKNNSLWADVDFRNFWSKKEKLFSSIILCGEVENQIATIGNSNYFRQILERLKEFDRALSIWVNGEEDFNYRSVNENYALRISPESQPTMAKFGNERIFRMPNGGTETFELHIKTGDLRFHFFVDNVNRKVFVGYIGSHLSTISN